MNQTIAQLRASIDADRTLAYDVHRQAIRFEKQGQHQAANACMKASDMASRCVAASIELLSTHVLAN